MKANWMLIHSGYCRRSDTRSIQTCSVVRCAALRPPSSAGRTVARSVQPPPSGVRARYIIMPLGLGLFVWALLTLLGAVKCPIFKSISIRIDLLVSENWHAYLFSCEGRSYVFHLSFPFVVSIITCCLKNLLWRVTRVTCGRPVIMLFISQHPFSSV